MKLDKIIKLILKDLKSLKPYIYHTATTGSVYIKFENSWIGSLRIGDHSGREKYSYKWNLRKDILSYHEILDRGTWRRYYPINEFERMCIDMKQMDSIKYTEFKITE